MTRFAQKPIRVRLAFLMSMAYGGLLVVYAALMVLLLHWYLQHSLDGALKEDIELAQQLLWSGGEHTIPDDIHEGDVARVERQLELWSIDRGLLYRSGTLRGNELGGAPVFADFDGRIRISSQRLGDGLRWRVASVAFDRPSGRAFLRLAVSEEPFYEDIQDGMTMIALGIVPGLLIVALLGYLLAYRALRPVDVMAATAKRIGAETLSERIPVGNPGDELGRLALTLNDLLNRVERAFEQLRRFTADASHELRTPLTVMRSVGEVVLQGGRGAGEYRDAIGSMLEENARLTHLVESLLLLSRAEAGRCPVVVRPVALLPLLTNIADTIGVLADDNRQSITIACDADITLHADEALLRRAMLNILDNAVKFSPHDTPITIAVHRGAGATVHIDVIDRGPGIAPGERNRVFDRFYRVGLPGPAVQGSGLGLAIVRWAVEAMGGTVNVLDTTIPGTTIRITLASCVPE